MTEEKKELEVNYFEEVPADYTGEAVVTTKDADAYASDQDYYEMIERVNFENGIKNGMATSTTYLHEYDYRTGSYDSYLDSITYTPFVNGKIQGVVKTYAFDKFNQDDKILNRVTPYVNGEKHGEEKVYSKDNFGEIIKTAPYSHGQLDGIVMEVLHSGATLYTPYKNGKKNGVQEWYEDDKLREETTYADDIKVCVKDYTKGTVTYNDGRVEKISEEEMKNPVGTREKIASAKERLYNHFKNPNENAQRNTQIRTGIENSTPIKEVSADAPFRVSPKKRGSIGE